MQKLTVKQEAFCRAYIKTGNATESYKLAGYSANTDGVAGVEGHKLLKNPKIMAALQNRMQEIADNSIMEEQEILSRLTTIGRGEATNKEQVATASGQVVEIENKPSVRDQIKALELLGKRYAIWTEKVDINEPLNITIKRKDD